MKVIQNSQSNLEKDQGKRTSHFQTLQQSHSNQDNVIGA